MHGKRVLEQRLAHVLDRKKTHAKLLSGVALFVVIVTKSLQPPLDVLSWNTKIPFSGMNSVVSSVQDKKLLLLHGVLASNGLDTSGLLPINR